MLQKALNSLLSAVQYFELKVAASQIKLKKKNVLFSETTPKLQL